LADFVPQGWTSAGEEYPLLNPARVDSLSMGANLATVWKEKAMAFGIAEVALCENSTGVYAPTSALNALRLPFLENGITHPNWIVDPYFQSRPLQGDATLMAADGSPFAAGIAAKTFQD